MSVLNKEFGFMSKSEIQDVMVFLIDDNAGPQYLVEVVPDRGINIYLIDDKLSDKCHELTDSNQTQKWRELAICFHRSKSKKLINVIADFHGIFIGYDASYYKYHHRAILIKLDGYTYMVIANKDIITFNAGEEIWDFISYMGENDVLYPYAIGSRYVHFIGGCYTHHKMEKKELRFSISFDNIGEVFKWVC